MWPQNFKLFCLWLFVTTWLVAVEGTNWANSRSEKRIFKGWYTSAEDFPHHAAIVHRKVGTIFDDWIYKCGGSIISDRWILTAGHCLVEHHFEPLTPWYVRVAVGYDWSEFYWQLFKNYFEKVSKVIVHPEFDGFAWMDIGLLELEQRLTFCETVKPVNLPTTATNTIGNDNSIVGFGYSSLQDEHHSYQLLSGEIRIVQMSECRQLDGPQYWQGFGTHLCLRPTRKNIVPCRGDSGGGVVRQIGTSFTILGIMTLTDCKPETVKYAMNVVYYLKWIKRNVGSDLPVYY